MPSFDPNTYWEERLSERYALDGVGCSGLGGALNGWMYRVRRRVFLREMRAQFPQPATIRVLDIGSGTGFYVDRWHELGAGAVSGSDLTEVAVGNLRARYPADAFERFDVGAEGTPFGAARFDAVSAFDVLFHIVDDERFACALRNIHTLLAPGGVFAYSDNFVHGTTVRVQHQASRSLAEIEQALTDAGFVVERRRPVFVLLNAPVDSGSRLLHAWWKALSIAASRSDALGWLAGAVAYPLELALIALLREGPSTEFMICRRPLTSPGDDAAARPAQITV